MLIVYDSFTGNVKRFVEKTKLPNVRITEDLLISEPFILITYTFGFGQAPESTINFLQRNHSQLKAVASSGNKNWGEFYGKAAEIIADKYKVPSLMKFELGGTDNDVEKFKQEVLKFDRRTNSKLVEIQ